MKNFFISNSKDFLSPTEENFHVLLDKIKYIHNGLISNLNIESSRHSGNIPFSYADEIDRAKLPLNGCELPMLMDEIKEMFEGSVRWHSPNTLFNIAPSPLLNTVAISTIVNLYNPNTLWDFTSGKFILFEKKVIKFLSELIGWDYQSSDGLSTFGGKATLIYAIKAGLYKCQPNIINDGIKEDIVVISSDRAHYSIEDICIYLGIGKKNSIRIPTKADGSINIKLFKKIISKIYKSGRKVACIILNAGVTVDFCTDPINEITTLTRTLTKKYDIANMPHIHADSVVGWAWLTLKSLDLTTISGLVAKDIKIRILNMLKGLKYIEMVDSFSADFHKTGLCPYVSTFFIVKNKKDIHHLTKEESFASGYKSDKFGDFHIHHYTLENSRSGIGIATAWMAFKRLGVTGFQSYLVHMLRIGGLFKQAIKNEFHTDFTLVNNNTKGFESVIKINFYGIPTSWKDLLNSDDVIKKKYSKNCYGFKDFLYNHAMKNYVNCPLIGFIPHYKKSSFEESLPCFLIYPMSIYIDLATIKEVLLTLRKIKTAYESTFFPQYNYALQNTTQIATSPAPPR